MAPGPGGAAGQAIGRSRGGLTTKVVALVDALGNLARFVLLAGQRHGSTGVPPLLDGVAPQALVAGEAFDADWLRAGLHGRGAAAAIPPRSNRRAQIACDLHAHRWRHLIENAFRSLKAFRRVAARHDKTDESYAAMIHLAAARIASR